MIADRTANDVRYKQTVEQIVVFVLNYKRGSYSIMSELFLFWIAERHFEIKKNWKFSNKNNEYYTCYDTQMHDRYR